VLHPKPLLLADTRTVCMTGVTHYNTIASTPAIERNLITCNYRTEQALLFIAPFLSGRFSIRNSSMIFFFVLISAFLVDVSALSNYLDSLSAPKRAIAAPPPSTNYVDSISERTTSAKNAGKTSDTKDVQKARQPLHDLQDVAAATPSEHYAKNNPGAGWAGYKHPMFGGYLDALSSAPTPTVTD